MNVGPDPSRVSVVRLAGFALIALGMTIVFVLDYSQNGGNATVAMGASGTLMTAVVVTVLRLMHGQSQDPGDDID